MQVKAVVVAKSQIEYNRSEIEQGLQLIKEKYTDIVFAEDQIKEAKEERAKLNKVAKNIAIYRKNVVSEATADIDDFVEFMKKSEKEAKALADNIGDQIKIVENKEIIEGKEKVKRYIKAMKELYPSCSEHLDNMDLDAKVFNLKSNYSGDNIGKKIKDYIDDYIKKAFVEVRQKKVTSSKKYNFVLDIKNCSREQAVSLKEFLDNNNFDYNLNISK